MFDPPEVLMILSVMVWLMSMYAIFRWHTKRLENGAKLQKKMKSSTQHNKAVIRVNDDSTDSLTFE